MNHQLPAFHHFLHIFQLNQTGKRKEEEEFIKRKMIQERVREMGELEVTLHYLWRRHCGRGYWRNREI